MCLFRLFHVFRGILFPPGGQRMIRTLVVEVTASP